MYYIYAYLRSKNSATANAGTPYYIGKGEGTRAYDKHTHVNTPKDIRYIVIMENALSELGAFALERRYIRWYGRKDLGTGILLNQTAGGEGACGRIASQETRRKLSKSTKDYYNSLTDGEKLIRRNNTKIPTTLGLTWPEETKKQMSESQTGKIAINDGIKCITIHKSLFTEYAALGWIKGRLQSDKKYINKDGNIKKISPAELDRYIIEGWELGRGPLSQDIKDKIGQSNAGRPKKPHTAEQRKATSDRLKQEWEDGTRSVTGMSGKNHTDESKKKTADSIREWHKKRKEAKLNGHN